MEIKTDFQFEAFCKIVKNIPFYKDHKERPRLFFEGLIFLEKKVIILKYDYKFLENKDNYVVFLLRRRDF